MKHLFLRFLCGVLICLPAVADEQQILRLQKGVFNYHYLTDDFANALQYLKQSRENGYPVSADTEVLEANMLLTLGLQQQAQEKFVSIEQQSEAVISAKTWFLLAKRWFQLADYQAVLDTIENIQIAEDDLNTFGEDRFAETQFMKATALIELGQHNLAQEQISKMSRFDIWTGYARHNYLLAMFQGNNSGRSLSLLIEDAAFYTPKSEEGKNLKDRINLIAALHFLKDGKYRTAEKYLKRISLDGPYTPAALLQLGWARVEQENYQQAFQPWRELQLRYNIFEPDVMESLLAVPHVLELMGAYTQALKIFESSEVKLLTLQQRVKNTQQQLTSNPWLDDWIKQQDSSGWGWQAEVNTLFEFNQYSALLKGLMTQTDFINALKEYRELTLITQHLTEKETHLLLWLDLVKQRQQQSQVDRGVEVTKRAKQLLDNAKQQLSTLQSKLEQSTQDLFALPNAAEKIKMDSLSRAVKSIEKLNLTNTPSRNLQPYMQRWRRVNGVFLWHMQETKSQKQWQLKQQLTLLDELIKRSNKQLLQTRLAIKWSPQAWQGMSQRVNELLTATANLKAQTVMARQQSKKELMQMADVHLTQLHLRINDYLGQTRLSIARLYDDALQKAMVKDAAANAADLADQEVR